MTRAFLSGGVVMWPMLAVALGLVWIAARTTMRLRAAEAPAEDVERGLHALLFWGGMGVLLGVLGTITGLVIMTQAIGRAGAVEAPLVWGGVGVSLVSLIFGLLIFIFAALAWFPLRQWSLRRAQHGTAGSS